MLQSASVYRSSSKVLQDVNRVWACWRAYLKVRPRGEGRRRDGSPEGVLLCRALPYV